MNDFFSNYFSFVLQPRKSYQYFSFKSSHLNLGNLILSSWFFYSVSSFFNLSLIIFLKSRAFSFFYFDKGIFDLTFEGQVQMALIIYLIGVISFPFVRLTIFYFYKVIFLFFDKSDSRLTKNNFDPLTHFLIADIFYLIPLIGSQLRFIFSFFYLFISFKEGLKLNSLSSLLFVAFPIILISFFAVFLLFLSVFVFMLYG